MGLFKKKNVVFLASIALCVCATFVHSAEPNTDEKAKSLFDNSGYSYGNKPESGNEFDAGEALFKMILMILLVVVLGIAVIYVSKKLLPKFTNLPGKKIRIIETVHLGPRKTVHLLEIGNQQLLIGSTNENISRLADITDAFSEMDLPGNQTGDN